MFIVIEGGDGVGKSTLCPKLAQLIGGVSCKTPPSHYQNSRYRIDHDASPIEKYRYYKAGTMEASSHISRLIQGGAHVVVDRYWLTTMIYHEIIGVPVKRSDFDGILEPDLTILLSLDAETQTARMQKRGLTIRDIQMVGKHESIAVAYYRHILAHKIPFVALDGTALGPDDLARVCADIVLSRLGCPVDR